MRGSFFFFFQFYFWTVILIWDSRYGPSSGIFLWAWYYLLNWIWWLPFMWPSFFHFLGSRWDFSLADLFPMRTLSVASVLCLPTLAGHLESETEHRSVVSNSLWPLCDHFVTMDYTVHGILQARILEWVAFPFQAIFPTQGLNPGLLNCTQILYQLSHREALLVTLEGDWTFQNFATLLSLTCFSFFFICSHFPLFQWYYLIPGSSESNIWCYLTYYSLHVI